jgi:hypothetical protein
MDEEERSRRKTHDAGSMNPEGKKRVKETAPPA